MHGKGCKLVAIAAHAAFTSSMHFHAAVIANALRTGAVANGRLVISGNAIEYSNSIRIRHVTNENEVVASNDVVYNNVRLANSLRSNKSVAYGSSLLIGKSLADHRVHTHGVLLRNILRKHHVGNDDLRVQPLHDTVFAEFSVLGCRKNDSTLRVSTGGVRTRQLAYHALRTNATVLYSGDVIRRTVYSASVNLSQASYIVLIGQRYQECRLGATWDECSTLPYVPSVKLSTMLAAYDPYYHTRTAASTEIYSHGTKSSAVPYLPDPYQPASGYNLADDAA